MEAWRKPSGWGTGYPLSFYCAHCWLSWYGELREVQGERSHQSDNDLHYGFAVKCSRGHRKAKTLHTGTLHIGPSGSTLEWTTSYLGVPHHGEPRPDGGRKVSLRCPSCRLDRQMQTSLLAKALQALVEAGTVRDSFYRVLLDIAHVPC